MLSWTSRRVISGSSTSIRRKGFMKSALVRQVVHDADENTFKKHIEETKDKIILVDFYEDWCGPCRILSPLLERIEKDPSVIGSDEPLDLITIKGESAPELAMKYQIRAVPTVFAFKNETIIGNFMGAMPLPQIKTWFAGLPKN